MAKILLRGCVKMCNKTEAHFPHIREEGGYRTVRYGEVDVFCCGVAGPGAEFREVRFQPGSASDLDLFEWEELEKVHKSCQVCNDEEPAEGFPWCRGCIEYGMEEARKAYAAHCAGKPYYDPNLDKRADDGPYGRIV